MAMIRISKNKENIRFPNNAKNLFLGFLCPNWEPFIAYTKPIELIIPEAKIGIAIKRSDKLLKDVFSSNGLTSKTKRIEKRKSLEDSLTYL